MKNENGAHKQFPIGEIVQVTCKDIDKAGYGISTWNKRVLVTPELVPGDTAYLQIKYRSGSRWFTNIVNFSSLSLHRRIPPCDKYRDCGCCSIQHITDEQQYQIKINQLEYLIGTTLKIDCKLTKQKQNNGRNINYRNRAIMPFSFDNNQILMGYYKRNTHTIIDINYCLVLDERINRSLIVLRSKLESLLKNGELNINAMKQISHICIRTGANSDQSLLTFVTRKYSSQFTNIALKIFDQNIAGITLNIQPESNNVIFGKNTKTLIGKPYIEEVFCGLKFRIASTTFFQINSPQAETVVNYIILFLKKYGNVNSIIDSYCGIGTISLPLANSGYYVIGIEINQDSIKQAKDNAYINNIDNVQFINGDVSNILEEYLTGSVGLILDPPRKGLDIHLLQVIIKYKPKLIAYLSCNPSTMIRDLKYLLEHANYTINQIYPIDFFPQTTHMECLAIISLANS